METKTPKRQKHRTTKPLTMSFPPDVVAWMDQRVQTLRPKAVNRSHYVQLLIEADKLGKVFPKIKPALLAAAGFVTTE